jgi:hypothetical protein
MATHVIFFVAIWALVIVGICRWFYLNSDRRDPLHDLSDKQADFASVDDDVLIERMVRIHSGENA